MALKPTLSLLTALLLAPLAALHAADATSPVSKVAVPAIRLPAAAPATPGVTLESRRLPLALINNDSEDLKFPAYPVGGRGHIEIRD